MVFGLPACRNIKIGLLAHLQTLKGAHMLAWEDDGCHLMQFQISGICKVFDTECQDFLPYSAVLLRSANELRTDVPRYLPR